MRFIICMTSILILNSAFSAEPTFCALKEEFHKKEKLSISEGIAKVLKKDVSIVFLGEPHNNYGKEMYPLILDELEDQGFHPDCFLLERDQGRKLINELNVLNRLPVSEIDPELNKLLILPSDKELVNEMHKRGMKVYAIDDHSIEDLDDTDWLNARDAVMDYKIAVLKITNECHSFLYPMGFKHVSSGENARRYNLAQRLAKRGINSMAIYMDFQGLEESAPGATHIGRGGKLVKVGIASNWIPAHKLVNEDTASEIKVDDLMCKRNPGLTLSPYAMLSDRSDQYDMNEDTKEIKMSDYDLSITYSCNETDCRRNNLSIVDALKNGGAIFY